MTQKDIVSRTLRDQVYDLLVQRIGDGTWQAGADIASEQVLAAEFGVSVGTMRRALSKLESNGLLVRRRGRGTRIADAKSSSMEARAFKFVEGDKECRFENPKYEAIELSEATQAEAGQLGVARGTPVVRLNRVYNYNGKLAVLDKHIYCGSHFPGLEKFGPEDGLLGDYIFRKYGAVVSRKQERLSVQAATPEVARLLGIGSGDAVLVSVGVFWSRADERIAIRVRYAHMTGVEYVIDGI